VFVASAVINVGVFLLAFRLATANEVALRNMVPGAVISGVLWQVLLVVGTFLVAHQVRRMQSLYGTFGVVLGLLAWLHLQATPTLYAAAVAPQPRTAATDPGRPAGVPRLRGDHPAAPKG
jgi:membrane protein